MGLIHHHTKFSPFLRFAFPFKRTSKHVLSWPITSHAGRVRTSSNFLGTSDPEPFASAELGTLTIITASRAGFKCTVPLNRGHHDLVLVREIR